MIVEQNGEFCTFKHDANNKPVGKTHGCFPSRAEAEKQLAALYAAEGKSFDMDELKAKTKEGFPASDFLVVEDAEKTTTWHLQVKRHGKIDTGLLGAAHAALLSSGGHRGNQYAGPGKEEAISKLKGLYKEAGLEWPKEGKSLKMMGDMPMAVPYGALTLADAQAAMDAQEEVQELSCKIDMFKQVVDNISMSPDVTDKAGAIKQAADELSAMLAMPEEDDTTKSFKAEAPMTGMAADHQHKVMGDATSESQGHKHKVVDGKVQMADGHTHSMPKDEGKAIDYTTIKSLGKDRVGGYAVLWGDEDKKDLTGEFFDKNTEELTVIYDAVGKLPFLYHHGLDNTLKTRVMGVVDTLKPDSIGMWYEAQLKSADEYDETVKKLIGDGKLKTSTQTFAVARRVSKTGHIERWPIVEITSTVAPAEYRMQPIAALKSAFQEVGCTDFACVLKSKLGIEEGGLDNQGAEKARLLATLELSRLRSMEL